ncbi:MAG: glycoside hydrolase family 28 protein [Saprospiraceae bacterium]|nr:glycoside hydrolase family 28 protein [Saprospiraceae bacterium]
MKKYVSFLATACLLLPLMQWSCASPPPAPDPWDKVAAILENIQAPVFPDRDFSILDFGAAPDGSDALPAIQAAIAACHAAGGGRVVVPAGSFAVNGSIHLKSNVNLHVSEGAVLLFGTDPKMYLPLVLTRWEGMECMNYAPLIYAYEQENIAITGKGVLDGQASNEHWWPWSGKDTYGWEKGSPSQRDSANRPELSRMNTAEVPVAERIFGEGHYLRPNFIQPYRCKNILIEAVTVKNSPMWVIHPVLSDNITIQGVRVISHGPNSDGCDPEACSNVLIQDCYFDTGDDCIALKSGRNQDGRNIGRAIENVVIRNCEMKDGHGGVVIGSEVSGGARNIFAENCTMDSPNLERAIRIKTNKSRGGVIEDLYFRNIEVGVVKEAVVRINMLYAHDGEPDIHLPVIRNVYIENVRSKSSEYGLMLDGYDENHKISDIFIENCTFDGVEKGNRVQAVERLNLKGVYANGKVLNVEE